jgi:hypothetical protein
MATRENTATRAAGKSARAAAFRAAPETKVGAAAEGCVTTPESKAKLAAFVALEKSCTEANTAEAIFDLIAKVDRVGAPGSPDWPGDWNASNRMSERLAVLHTKLHRKLLRLEGPYPPQVAAQVLKAVRLDLGRNSAGHSWEELMWKLVARVEREVQGRASPAPVSTTADADLIRICAEHAGHIAAVNEHGSGEDDCPLWLAYARSRDAIRAAVPLTVAGMVAKASAAKAEAACQDGIERYENCPAGDMAWDLVNDLLRLSGDQPAPAAQPPCPVWAHAEDLAALDDELEKLASTPDHDRITKGHYRAAGERHDALWLLVGASRPVSEKGALLALISAAKISTEAADNELTQDELVAKIQAVRNLVAGAFFVLAERHPHPTLARLQTGWLPRYTYRLSTHEEVAAEEAARTGCAG